MEVSSTPMPVISPLGVTGVGPGAAVVVALALPVGGVVGWVRLTVPEEPSAAPEVQDARSATHSPASSKRNRERDTGQRYRSGRRCEQREHRAAQSWTFGCLGNCAPARPMPAAVSPPGRLSATRPSHRCGPRPVPASTARPSHRCGCRISTARPPQPSDLSCGGSRRAAKGSRSWTTPRAYSPPGTVGPSRSSASMMR